ncbi:FMN-linked oxidoreductase [Westerdykella ornata]|uniref:FMN-linked oxidoreductase n=1 Tax=Westerdykella ornata TaxID=318751 RepID=A0A6A6JFL0_WESOR|nr:FMN-linked oxidoreductase [Westerdykella ornata]KAF2275410.1 FMN-linked oxidoreductase [Westerdykella ornata]
MASNDEAIPFFIPKTSPPPGSAVELTNSTPTLFKPLKIRDVTFQNRIFMAPMCMFSCASSGPAIGSLTPYHLIHLGHPALKGASLVIIEATAVTPNGRISPNDSGLWDDLQIAGVKNVADAVHAVGGKLGIQLAHAGRKASTVAPWFGRQRGKGGVAEPEVGGWPDDVVGPSAIQWSETYCMPREMTKEDIRETIEAFADAARRAVKAGVDVIELHGAHGYLLSSFVSPLSNQRTDEYGGSFENRIRFNVEVIKAVREAIPPGMPLFYRITSTEWMEESDLAKELGSWDVEQSIRFAKLLAPLGVDLLDVSSGGNHVKQRIWPHSNYQVGIAGQIRRALKEAGQPLLVGAVGMITEADQAKEIVEGKEEAVMAKRLVEGPEPQADAILIGRQLLREPEWVLRVAFRLGVEVQWPLQFGFSGKFLKGSKV